MGEGGGSQMAKKMTAWFMEKSSNGALIKVSSTVLKLKNVISKSFEVLKFQSFFNCWTVDIGHVPQFQGCSTYLTLFAK